MYNKKIDVKKDKTLGYLYFMDKNHPLSDKKGRVWHHRHVSSISMGRWVNDSEVIHHIDGDRENNDPDNLEVMGRIEHGRLHRTGNKDEWKESICPNCGNTFYKSYTKQKYCSNECVTFSLRRAERPSKQELVDLISNNSWKAIGRIYSVSDNAVRKWAKKYGII